MNYAAVASRLKTFEGTTDYMYRCTGGEVTVGTGHAIADAAHAAALPWISPPGAEPVAAGFARVASAPKGLPAVQYRNLTQSRLAQASIDALLQADIASFEQALLERVPGFAGFPEPAQEALLDMSYNLGIGGLLKFPKLLAACEAGQWADAATECHRAGVAEARNQETADLFRQASAS